MSITPPGYARLVSARARGVVLESCRSALETILANETIYDFAARQPEARKFRGRATVYAFQLPDGSADAVVRRSMRGGALSGLNTDLFLLPTRGLRELIASLRLRSADVPTPEVIAFITYPAGPFFRRGDVITREIEGADLASILVPGSSEEGRRGALEATAATIASLARIGAHHPDLNLRNILVGESNDAPLAWVLDVDRIRFHVPGDPMVLRANIDRLEGSLRKRRDLGEIAIGDAEMAALRARVMELAQ